MMAIVVMMIVALLIAGALVLYVAFPHRGETLPKAPWLGKAMNRAVEAMPTLDESESRR